MGPNRAELVLPCQSVSGRTALELEETLQMNWGLAGGILIAIAWTLWSLLDRDTISAIRKRTERKKADEETKEENVPETRDGRDRP